MALLDLIRPRWKNSDPKIRLQAVNEMDKDQMEIIRRIAEDDPDTDVKIAAALKISDENFLEALISRNKDARLAAAIKERLNAIRKETVLKSDDINIKKTIMAKIDDPEVLCQIAIKADNPEIRLIAVGKIDDPGLLCKITENNCGLKTGLEILRKLAAYGNKDHIKHVSLKASGKKLRKKAKALLEPEPEKKEEIPVRDDKTLIMENLCKKLEDAHDLSSLSSLEKILEDADKSIAAIDPGKKHPLGKKYESIREKLIFRVNQIKNELKLKQELESLCKKAEKLLISDNIGEKADRIWQKWESIKKNTELMPGCKSHEDRFLKIWDKLEQKKSREEKAKEEKKKKQKLLETCLSDIEKLTEKAGIREAGVKLKELCAAWDDAWFESSETLELKEKFNTLCRKFEKAAKEYEKKEEDKKAAQKEKLLMLCKKVEEAVNADKRAGLEIEVKAAQKEWREAGNLIPEIKEELSERFGQACADFFTKQREYWEKLEWERWANYNRKEELCKVVEAVNRQGRLENTGNIIMEARKRWRDIGPVSKKHSVEIWNRFNKACDEAYKRCFKEKELLYENLMKIIAEKEEDGPSSFNWSGASQKVKDIQAQWNLIGPLPQAIEKDLKTKFKSACDLFFGDLRAFYDEMDKKRLKNLELKKELCKEAETLAASNDQAGASKRLKEIQKKWKEIGPIPKSEGDGLWNRFQAACNTFFDRLKSSEPENLKKKEELCARAEELILEYESGKDMNVVSREFMELQKEWKKTGPVPGEYSKELWERFHKPCDGFFMKRKEFLENRQEEMAENRAIKEKLVDEAISLSESDEWKKTGDMFKELRARWKETGPAGKSENELWKKFNKACDTFFKRKSLFIKGMESKRKENLRKKKELCLTLEALSRLVLPECGHKECSPDEAARQLRIALDLKQEVVVPSNPRETWDRAMKKVREIRKKWKETGPVPREKDELIWKRFRKASDLFFKRPEKNNVPTEKKEKKDE